MTETGVAADQLKSIIERVERLDEEIKALNDDKRDVYAEAVANGFDRAALKELVKLRRQDIDERLERRSILELYADAIGVRL